MSDSSVLIKQFDGTNYSQYFPQNIPLNIANQFINSSGKNSMIFLITYGNIVNIGGEKHLKQL